MHAKSSEHGAEKVRSPVEVTEDDRRRAQDAALSVRPLLASKFLGIDCPLVEAIALALAETRRQAEERYADENARLHDALKRAELGYQDGLS